MKKTLFSLVACATLVASTQANTLELEPVVVSATKTEQSLKETTANVQIITADELEEKHVISVIDALRTLTNIPVTQSGGLGQQSSFFQRGFASENTIILIDGIRYNDPTTNKGQAQLEHLMINDIERIEIINGAQSGVWGANAVAGVINIISKKPTEQLQIAADLEYGSYATTKLGTSISQKTGPFSYYIGANQLKTDGFSAVVPNKDNPEDYEADGYLNQTLNAKLGYDITPLDTLRGQFTFIDANTHYDAPNSPNSSANEIHQINRIGNIGYRHSFHNNDFIDATYAITTFDKKDPLGSTKAFEGTNKESSILGNYHYSANGYIVTGANFLDSKNTINSKELDSKGVFFTNTNHLNSLILTESIRHDMYDSFNDKTTGKIGAKYFLTNDFVFSGNYGTAYRIPSLYELYAPSFTIGVTVYPVGNVNLVPETTKSFDTTIQYKNLSLTYFNNTIDNLIDYTSGYNNVEGKSTFKGYEVRYSDSLLDILTLDVTYSKLSAKDKNGNYLVRRPQESLKGSASYYPTSKSSIGTIATYIGTRPDLSNTQTGNYTLWSAFANYDVTKNLTIYLKGENLTDKRYQKITGYGTAGRSFYAGLNAKF